MSDSETPSPCQAHPESVNARLAAHLRKNQDGLGEEWLRRVRQDPEIATESMTREELRAYLPTLFENLIQALCEYGSEEVAEKAERNSAKHGAKRWQQGYDLTELLREIGHLRAAIIYQLQLFEVEHPDFGMMERLFVSSTVHRFLDDLMAAAADQFVKREKAEG